jgi:hypothetical protein
MSFSMSLEPAAALECCMCYDGDVAVAEATSCNRNHVYCKECFGHHVKNLCEKRVPFLKDDCRVFCMQCRIDGFPPSEDFDMQIAVSK